MWFKFQWQIDKLSQDLGCGPAGISYVAVEFNSYEIHPDMNDMKNYSDKI